MADPDQREREDDGIRGEYPEMNHNHMVGWAEDCSESELLPVFLIDSIRQGL